MKKHRRILPSKVGPAFEVEIYTYILEEGDDPEQLLTFVRTIHPGADIEIGHRKVTVKYFKKGEAKGESEDDEEQDYIRTR